MSVNSQKSKKALTSVLLAAVIFAGGYYVYDQGFMPGVGGSKQDVAEITAKIKELEGTNIEKTVYEIIAGNSLLSRMPDSEEQNFRSALKETLDKDIDVIFTYKDIEADDGVVKIIAPKLSIVSSADKSKDYDITVPVLKISKDTLGGHYVYEPEGDIDFLADMAKSGEKSKIFSVKYEKLSAEMKFEDGFTTMQKLDGKNLKLVEGRSGTMLVSVAEINNETTQAQNEGRLKISTKAKYTHIAPGDMIKLFIGNIEPVDVALDYTSEESLQPPAEQKKPDGALKVNNFSIKMGKAGLESSGDFKYNSSNDEAPAIGDAYVKFTDYHKILTLLQKYYPIRPEDMGAVSKALMEMGADEGDDASFDLKFDGTEKILINGKTESEFNMILDRHFPKVPQAEETPKKLPHK